jgi:hypothetical protein
VIRQVLADAGLSPGLADTCPSMARAAEVAREHVARKPIAPWVYTHATVMLCALTERRLFGALLAEPGVLSWCPDVETDDFTDLHLRFAFAAIRNLQARGAKIDLLTVEDELARLGYQQVDIVRVGETALEPCYLAESLVRIDAKWLRRLANRRRNA